MFKQRDKGKDKSRDRERRNSSGSESSLSQSSVSSSPKPSAKNAKHNSLSDSKGTVEHTYRGGGGGGKSANTQSQCPEMYAKEIHELYDGHHKVSPTLNSY